MSRLRLRCSLLFASSLSIVAGACGAEESEDAHLHRARAHAAEPTGDAFVKGPPGIGTEPFVGEPLDSTTSDDGLIVETFVRGRGLPARTGDFMLVHYLGYLGDGTMFDSSLSRGEPLGIEVDNTPVIDGWIQGLKGAKAGDALRLVIPPKLGYGDRAMGPIPANSTLVFTIEVVDLVDSAVAPAFDDRAEHSEEREFGLKVDDISTGAGDAVKHGDVVSVHYIGKLSDGTQFDSSVERKRPLSFRVGDGRVIAGWDLGLVGMKVGGLRRLRIPAGLAYGEVDRGTIPPHSDLDFGIRLLSRRDAPEGSPPARSEEAQREDVRKRLEEYAKTIPAKPAAPTPAPQRSAPAADNE